MNKYLPLMLLIILMVMTIACPYHSTNRNTMNVQPSEDVEVDSRVPEDAETSHPRIVMITIDGVRWQDIFVGPHLYPLIYKGKAISARDLLPNLYQHFVDEGMVVGRDSPFLATGPAHISLPGYLEIMRGHPSFDCQTNDCEPKIEETMADLFETSAVFGSWDTIRKTVGKNSDKFVVNCGRNYRSAGWKQLGLPDSTSFPEYWDPLYRPDSLTQQAVLDYLKNNNPQFLWVSLGDTDEWAHAGNYDKYIESLVEADKFVGQMVNQLSSKDTTFIITADHGRSKDWRSHGWDVESSKDWLMLSGRKVPKKGFVKYDGTKRLSDILPTVRHLLTNVANKDSLL
jgi:hypothetical protein